MDVKDPKAGSDCSAKNEPISFIDDGSVLS